MADNKKTLQKEIFYFKKSFGRIFSLRNKVFYLFFCRDSVFVIIFAVQNISLKNQRVYDI